MTETPPQVQVEVWRPSQAPFSIECAPAVLDQIRIDVVDAFFSFRRGGAEVGGVLFGVKTEDTVRITAYQQLRCEYATGPSFVLSQKDQAGLAAFLNTYRSEPELRDLDVVGWYHSHTRSDLFLSFQDVEIYDRFFPEPWQITLVLRPASLQPTRAAFFFREIGGSLRTESPHEEFVLAAPPRARQKEEELSLAAPAFPGFREATPESGSSREPTRARALISEGRPASVSLAKVRHSRWSWLAPLVLAAGIGTVFLTREKSVAPAVSAGEQVTPVAFEALETNGTVILRWDRRAPAVRDATSATLYIHDGNQTPSIEWDQRQLQSGVFSYARRSEKVDFRLILQEPDGRSVAEAITFLGKLPSRQPSPELVEAKRQRNQLARENERLRKELQTQIGHNRQLDQALTQMRTLLRHELQKGKK